jgi:tRNA (guanine37-N1)-methyltransferase
MIFNIFTIFPGIISGAVSESILGRALEKGAFDLNLVDIRDFTKDKHRSVDDYPYGGGPGMVMKPEPLFEAVESVPAAEGSDLLILSPAGETFSHAMAQELAERPSVGIICGRYEGIDDRVTAGLGAREVSVGDFVLTGGEFAALVIIDAVARLMPGVLGDDESPVEESFASGLLEYPHYTRPAAFRDHEVPEVLLSGNHAEIDRWRRQQSLLRTLEKRPDLLDSAELTEEDLKFLDSVEKGKSD